MLFIKCPKRIMSPRSFLFCLLTIYFCNFANAALRLPRVFGDHMVLQRDKPVAVWGWADPGAVVSIEFAGLRLQTRTRVDGRWRLTFPAQPAGGPLQMRVVCGEETRTFSDILIGEVWLAGGQSNMEWPLYRAEGGAEAIREADYSGLRLFHVPRNLAATPQDDLQSGRWSPSTPRTVRNFSAVAFYFARDLYLEKGVPVGIIQATWGGSTIESWLSKEAALSYPALREVVSPLVQNPPDFEAIFEQNQRNAAIRDSLMQQSNRGLAMGVNKPGYDDAVWPLTELPAHFDEIAGSGHQGYIWFRYTFVLNEQQAGRAATLHIGRIQGSDITFLNGSKIGERRHFTGPRDYSLPANLLRAGENVLAIRVLHAGKSGGGINGGPLQIAWSTAAEERTPTLELEGTWRYNSEIEPRFPPIVHLQNYPGSMYNAMIAPWRRIGLCGFLWYQGESNTHRAYAYRDLFPLMIRDWRRNWRQGHLPFLFVQLPYYRQRREVPGESNWAELREAQLYALRKPATGMAVALDLGDSRDIHPRNKYPVAQRLLRVAKKKVYGEEVVETGPLFRQMRRFGDRIILSFTRTGEGLELRYDKDTLTGFAIAGEDQQFHWARAEVISPTEIAVYSEAVPKPVALRYAWADHPVISLYNSESLPASPFRTDNWTWITRNGKYRFELPNDFIPD